MFQLPRTGVRPQCGPSIKSLQTDYVWAKTDGKERQTAPRPFEIHKKILGGFTYPEAFLYLWRVPNVLLIVLTTSIQQGSQPHLTSPGWCTYGFIARRPSNAYSTEKRLRNQILLDWEMLIWVVGASHPLLGSHRRFDQPTEDVSLFLATMSGPHQGESVETTQITRKLGIRSHCPQITIKREPFEEIVILSPTPQPVLERKSRRPGYRVNHNGRNADARMEMGVPKYSLTIEYDNIRSTTLGFAFRAITGRIQ